MENLLCFEKSRHPKHQVIKPHIFWFWFNTVQERLPWRPKRKNSSFLFDNRCSQKKFNKKKTTKGPSSEISLNIFSFCFQQRIVDWHNVTFNARFLSNSCIAWKTNKFVQVWQKKNKKRENHFVKNWKFIPSFLLVVARSPKKGRKK